MTTRPPEVQTVALSPALADALAEILADALVADLGQDRPPSPEAAGTPPIADDPPGHSESARPE
ncbi:MAG: hypothetical protein ACRDHF_12015 [Tepidiformaceae bacterium]